MRVVMQLRWIAGSVGAGSVPGGSVGDARFGVLRLGEERVQSWYYVGRGNFPLDGEGGVGLGMRLVGRGKAGR